MIYFENKPAVLLPKETAMRAVVKDREREIDRKKIEKYGCKCESAEAWERCENASKTGMKSIQCSITNQLTSSLSQTRIELHSMTAYQAVVLR